MSRLVGAITSDAENNGMIETMRLETIAAVNGLEKDAAFGSVVSPLCLASHYTSEGFEWPCTREYSRTNNLRISSQLRSPCWPAALRRPSSQPAWPPSIH
jgi:hypothetical protein